MTNPATGKMVVDELSLREGLHDLFYWADGGMFCFDCPIAIKCTNFTTPEQAGVQECFHKVADYLVMILEEKGD